MNNTPFTALIEGQKYTAFWGNHVGEQFSDTFTIEAVRDIGPGPRRVVVAVASPDEAHFYSETTAAGICFFPA